jgi:hypothetical protein
MGKGVGERVQGLESVNLGRAGPPRQLVGDVAGAGKKDSRWHLNGTASLTTGEGKESGRMGTVGGTSRHPHVTGGGVETGRAKRGGGAVGR